ncbi:MAG: DNA polymerase III subunit delta' [Mesorhizobium sp.]
MSERLAPEQWDSLPDEPEPAESVELVGHEAAVDGVCAAYRARKLHHGLLVTGPKGIGKATFAFHLAHYLLQNRDPDIAPDRFLPRDPSSALFRQIATGAHPSVLHLTRRYDEKTKKFRTAVTVDEVRRVSRFLSMRSHDDSYRIVIVDAADDMNRNAANALLKSLEEPPPQVVFVLVSHSPGALLPTIRSRCQVIRFSPLGSDELTTVLRRSGQSPPETGEARSAFEAAAGGSARQAILLTEYGGLDIAGAIDSYLGQTRRDPAIAYKLADAVVGREQEIQFEIFNAALTDRISAQASARAAAGDHRAAARLATLWTDISESVMLTDTYNLDKRQHVVSLLDRVASAMRAA